MRKAAEEQALAEKLQRAAQEQALAKETGLTAIEADGAGRGAAAVEARQCGGTLRAARRSCGGAAPGLEFARQQRQNKARES